MNAEIKRIESRYSKEWSLFKNVQIKDTPLITTSVILFQIIYINILKASEYSHIW